MSNKKIRKGLLLLLFGATASASFGQGIRFEQNLSWEEVQAKAKAAHQYIFVDCYATWCGPCKEMDQKVYPDTTVGQVMNRWFVSVKVQMDSTKKDDEQTRAWYSSAKELKTENNVGAFPTLLFLSPEGKLVHKVVGTCSPLDFVKQTLYATDLYQQEYILMEYYKIHELPDALIPGLIRAFDKTGEKEIVTEIAQTYINTYLLKLPNELLFRNSNIELIGKYLTSSKDDAFSIFYKHANQADKVTQPGYAESVVGNLISREEIYPQLWHGDVRLIVKPDWKRINFAVSSKYNKSYADKTVNDAQIKWYKETKEWPELINAEIFKIEHYATDNAGQILPDWEDPVSTINNIYFFSHSDNPAILQKAIHWQKLIVDKNPEQPVYLYIYANLLYKTGQKAKAIALETKCVQMNVNIAEQRKRQPNLIYQETLNKMKANQPTWVEAQTK